MDVPLTLRRWFVAHFVVGLVVGLPLLLVPALLLRQLGWTTVDGAAARLVGAALLAIGGQSYLARNAGLEVFTALVTLNMLWAYAAIAALLISIGEGAPPAVWALLSAFIALAGVWTHYRIRFKQRAGAGQLDDSQPQDE
jgi:drug/metabolite transporter (DMT)-like permease